MVVKDNQHATNSPTPKAEVGEIDTSAPFQSVKDAVTLFGEGAFSGEKPAIKKAKPHSAEVFVVFIFSKCYKSIYLWDRYGFYLNELNNIYFSSMNIREVDDIACDCAFCSQKNIEYSFFPFSF